MHTRRMYVHVWSGESVWGGGGGGGARGGWTGGLVKGDGGGGGGGRGGSDLVRSRHQPGRS